jgi:hypothetical protein
MRMKGREFLFVCGCPRSGTSYLQTLALASPDVAIGLERYSWRLMARQLAPADFEAERFLEVRPGDTFYDRLDFFPEHAKQLKERCSSARYVGDKVPRAFERLDWIAANFAPVKFLVIFRDIVDVAASYESRRAHGTLWHPDWGVGKAVEHWNSCISATLPWICRPNLLPIEYEALVTDPSVVLGIAGFLGVDPQPMVKMWEIQRKYGPSQVSGLGYERLSKVDRKRIEERANVEGWTALRMRARALACTRA